MIIDRLIQAALFHFSIVFQYLIIQEHLKANLFLTLFINVKVYLSSLQWPFLSYFLPTNLRLCSPFYECLCTSGKEAGAGRGRILIGPSQLMASFPWKLVDQGMVMWHNSGQWDVRVILKRFSKFVKETNERDISFSFSWHCSLHVIPRTEIAIWGS